MARRFAYCALVATLCAISPAQTDDKLRVGSVYTTNFPEIEVVIDSTPPAGQLETLFRADDIVLVEDGVPTNAALSLRRFRETGEGVAVVIAIDASGSMRGKPMEAVRQGLAAFVLEARPSDKVALMTFADDSRWETDWQTPREELRDRLQSIQARGNKTRLWDSVEQSLLKLDEAGLPARRRLIVISDGHDEGSSQALQAIIEHANKKRIPVDSIGLTRGPRSYLDNMANLSTSTHGIYREAPDLDSLKQMIGSGIRRLLDGPAARFKVSRIPSDGGFHRIGLRWRSVDQGDEVQIQTATTEKPFRPERSKESFPYWYLSIPAGALTGFAYIFWNNRRSRRRGMPPPVVPSAPPFKPASSPAVPEFRFEPVVGGNVAPMPTASMTPPMAINLQQAPPPLAHSSRKRTEFAASFSPPVPGRPAALLKIQEGPRKGESIAVDRQEFWIGAGANNHLQLDDDETVSGNHAYVRVEGSSLKIYDNHSTNNTWVNREPIGETARLLYLGDTIRIGRSVFRVEGTEKN